MGNFSIDLAKYAEARKEAMGDVVREIVMTVGATVDRRSPVGDKSLWTKEFIDVANKLGWIKDSAKGYIGGHFRANNQYQFGSPATSEVGGVDPSGDMAMAKIKAGVMSAPIAGLHYVSNNVPYAQALEDGHSTQAPQGIYGLAAMDVSMAANEIIKARFG